MQKHTPRKLKKMQKEISRHKEDKSKKQLEFKLHTIIMLVGPSNSGKTYFAHNHLLPELRKFDVNVQYISSDQIRRNILGKPNDYDKLAPEMLHSSASTHAILNKTLEEVTKYPINAELVVVDTLGLAEEFRTKIEEIARQNHYNLDAIVFDYKDRKDYFKYMPEGTRQAITLTSKHIDKLRREALGLISKRKYGNIYKITSHDFDEYLFSIVDYNQYKKYKLRNDTEYVVIGDVHGCYDEFIELIQKFGYTVNAVEKNGKEVYKLSIKDFKETPTNKEVRVEKEEEKDKKIILLGDYIDKGPKTKEILEFIYENRDFFILLKGNHENFVYKYLNGQIEDIEFSTDFLDYNFDSIELFNNNEELKQKFYELYYTSTDFVVHTNFIATHAPVENKYLGKIGNEALKKQRNVVYAKRKDYTTYEEWKNAVENELDFVKQDATFNFPLHFFGHIPSKNGYKVFNKVSLDTGCVSGNKLSAVAITPTGKTFFKDVKSKSVYRNDELLELFKRKVVLDLEAFGDLEPHDIKRIAYISRNKVNFISGTMAPADKLFPKISQYTEENEHSIELESLEQGIEYYKRSGETKIILQPKYMGSRCNIYLFSNVEKSYAVSRNGFVIDQVDLSGIFVKLHKKLESYFNQHNLEMLLIDGELLPWIALGKGLIEEQYGIVSTAIDSEQQLLAQTGFDQELQEKLASVEEHNFKQLINQKNKKELVEEFGENNYRNMREALDFSLTYEGLEKETQYYKFYREQLDLYIKDTPLEYKPFSVLKAIKKSGEEVLYKDHTNKELYEIVSDDEYLEQEHWDLEKAKKFYNKLVTEKHMEGVVIKPEKAYRPGIAPYIKVRNTDYLTLVYGYDYQNRTKYKNLVKQKSVGQKLKQSIKEWELGWKMLETNYADINPDNAEYKQLIVNMIKEEKRTKILDPRL